MGRVSFLQNVTERKEINLRKDSNKEIKKLSKFVEAYFGLTLT